LTRKTKVRLWAVLAIVWTTLSCNLAPAPTTGQPSPTPAPSATAAATSTMLAATRTLVPATATHPPFPGTAVPAAQVVINGHVFPVEVADTEEERARGLMGRTFLPKEAGMLFVWPQDDYRAFWMKDTLIPLDVVFIDSASLIVDIKHMVAEPGVPDNRLTVYQSALPARYALEIAYDLTRELGITVGMTAEVRL